jgi:hypothetical protein
VHAAVLDANGKSPPRLDEPLFIAGLAAFVVALLAVSAAMFRRFRHVPGRR